MLNDKTIFITGGAQGIGLGIAEAVLDAGGKVAIGDLNAEALQKAQDSLTSGNDSSASRVFTTEVDVTKEKSVDRALSAANGHFGQLDGLVNSAGIIKMGPNIAASADDWRIQLEVNVIGMHICCRSFSILLDGADRSTAIVNIASNAGKVGYPNMAGYNASKAATISLTRTLSAEWADRNINVNSICPGGVDTPMLYEVAVAVGKRIGEDPAELIKTMVPAQLGRHIEPLEIGRVAVFLLSENAVIIRGQSINADGGDTPY
jgi:NAD(P)-dependent dehydrogenase (short-subunit alcohol dehydrogenase family)